VEDSDWEPDGVTHHVRFCEGLGRRRGMAEIPWHRRETRRQQRTQTSAYAQVQTRLLTQSDFRIGKRTVLCPEPLLNRPATAPDVRDLDLSGTIDRGGAARIFSTTRKIRSGLWSREKVRGMISQMCGWRNGVDAVPGQRSGA
jgi:hypothetical protein